MLHNGKHHPVSTFLRCVATIKVKMSWCFPWNGKMHQFQHLICSIGNKIWAHKTLFTCYSAFQPFWNWGSKKLGCHDWGPVVLLTPYSSCLFIMLTCTLIPKVAKCIWNDISPGLWSELWLSLSSRLWCFGNGLPACSEKATHPRTHHTSRHWNLLAVHSWTGIIWSWRVVKCNQDSQSELTFHFCTCFSCFFNSLNKHLMCMKGLLTMLKLEYRSSHASLIDK